MKWYRQAPAKAFNKQIDWDSDTLVFTLHTSTYTPNPDTHAFVSDLSNELASGSGYTAGTASGGGLSIASPSVTHTVANSWGTSRANSTAYNVDDVVRPATGNGFLYRCSVAGTSGGTVPSYSTTLGGNTTDGGVTWETVGTGIIVFACNDPSWASFSAGPFRIMVLSDRSSGSNATNPLLGYTDFGSDKTGGGGSFTANMHSTLRALHLFTV
jgi:hypothetical protein